jgi:hypothetical protein
MKENQGSTLEIEEELDPNRAQDMDLEEIVVEISTLREAHRDHNINNLTISQLRKLQRDMVKGKGVFSS